MQVERVSETLADAYDAAMSSMAPRAMLTVGLEDCDACVTLERDCIALADSLPDVSIHFGIITQNSTQPDLEILSRLGLHDFPTSFLIEGGKIVSGFVGYNAGLEERLRREMLLAMVSRRR